MTSRSGSWQPGGGVTRIYIAPTAHDWKLPRAEEHVARNGIPDYFTPYVWNIGERLRRAQVDEQLREIRQIVLDNARAKEASLTGRRLPELVRNDREWGRNDPRNPNNKRVKGWYDQAGERHGNSEGEARE
jgi:hypothetical protein